MTIISSLEIAQRYVARGWAVVPIPSRQKAPRLKNWQNLRLTAADLPRYFSRPCNIGVLLGTPSGGLIDVDLDHPLALEVADQFLPATGAIFGRTGKLRSHRLYRLSNPINTHQRKHDAAGMVIEVRATGSQTVFPGSIHPSGELVEWHADDEPALVEPGAIMAAVNALADEVERRLGISASLVCKPSSDSRTVGTPCSAVLERVRRYLAKVPPAVSGQGGHDHTFKTACTLVLGFNLTPDEAYALIADWNQTCQPPWSEKELRHKLAEADKQPGERGYLLRTQGNRQASTFSDRTRGSSSRLIEIEPYRPFPIDALPGATRSFVVEAAAAIGCDISYTALPMLACLGRAIGGSRCIELKPGWSEPPIVWGAVVGRSGTAKTPALAATTAVLRKMQEAAHQQYGERMREFERDRLCYERNLARWKKDKGHDEPPEAPTEPVCVRYIASDITIEALADRLATQPDGLLIVRDELAGWLDGFAEYKGGKGSDVGHWLSCWSASPFDVDRKTGPKKVIHVKRPLVSIVGGVQPAILQRALGREHFTDGLCARLLLCYPPERPLLWSKKIVRPATENALAKTFGGLLAMEPGTDDHGHPTAVPLPFTPEAELIWEGYFNRHRAEQAELDDDLRAAWSKLEAYTARLALIIQLAGDPDSGTVSQDSLRAGIVLSDWFGHEAMRVYAAFSETDEDRGIRELVDWIRRQGASVTVRDLTRGPRRFRDLDVAEKALNALAKEGYGHWEPIFGGDAGGRPTRIFTLKKAGDGDKTILDAEKNWGFVAVASVASPGAEDPPESNPVAEPPLSDCSVDNGDEWVEA